jgi:hypothetical protein
MMRRTAVLLIGIVAAGASRAGELEFRDGLRVEVPFRVEGEVVRIEGPDRSYAFRRGDFRTMDPAGGVQAEWARRLADSETGTAEDRHAGVIWALRHGLTREGVEALEHAAEADPSHGPTARLARVARGLEAPCPDPSEWPDIPASPPAFRSSRSDHLVMLHQATASEAEARLRVLEDVLATYYLLLADLDLRLNLPRQRLVVVWFAQRADYQAFLRREHAGAFLETEGYYHPTRHFMAFFDQRSTERAVRVRASLASRGTRRTSDTERLALLEAFRRERGELGTAAHELVHALVRDSGLAPRHETIPVWLHEGLAMQFEVVRDGRWAGVGQPHPARLDDWSRSVGRSARLARVASDADYGRGFNLALYTQAWALVRFLWTDRPETFVALLDQLRAPRLDDRDPGAIAAASLGSASMRDPDTLDREWHRATDALAGMPVPDAGQPENRLPIAAGTPVGP